MRTHRAITLTGTIIVLALALVSEASAGSLLSGYGGPGQGNQAILGSALVNGPSGGGGSSGGGELSSSTGSRTGGAAQGAIPRASAHAGLSHAKGVRGKGPPRTSSGSAGAANTPETVSRAPNATVAGSVALGLSGADILYLILALAALIATGLLTRQMARRPGSDARRLKG
jgi:hypothetical protein